MTPMNDSSEMKRRMQEAEARLLGLPMAEYVSKAMELTMPDDKFHALMVMIEEAHNNGIERAAQHLDNACMDGRGDERLTDDETALIAHKCMAMIRCARKSSEGLNALAHFLGTMYKLVTIEEREELAMMLKDVVERLWDIVGRACAVTITAMGREEQDSEGGQGDVS